MAFALSEVAAIHADKLPQEPAVLAALEDARKLEPYSYIYTPAENWRYSIAQKDVADRPKADMDALTLAAKSHPENTELLLLTGLVAHFAYNLDVAGSYETTISAWERAGKLEPSDVRVAWFHADHICQTAKPKAGGEEFLAIEAGHPWEQLTPAFWDDYMACATITNMPAHFLRAAEHQLKLHTESSQTRSMVTDFTRNRYEAFDPGRAYEPKEIWTGIRSGDDTEFTSTTCGVRLHTHASWTINSIGLNGHGCIANFSSGPYKGTTRNLSPSILIVVKQAEENETLQDFAKKYAKGTIGSFTPARCPASNCIALMGVQAGLYKEDGDGRGRIVAFAREQPAYPGLIFESPMDVPDASGGEGAKAYSPGPIRQRIPGTLYYLVLLDTAASIEEPAMKDFDYFLENLTVE